MRLGCGFESREEPYFLLPGFMMGTNRGDAPLTVDSKCPRLRKSPTEFPASPWWLVRADRLSHPVALLRAEGRIAGVLGDVQFSHHGQNRFAGFGCDIDRGLVFYTLGWENAPWLFVQSHTYYERVIEEGQCITLQPGECLRIRLTLFDLPSDALQDVNAVIRTVYSLCHQPPRAGATLP